MPLDLTIPGVSVGAELGRGASSVVYRGVRADAPCAIKVARPIGRGTRWFRREASALARVAHPGVPRVLAVGEASGRAYLVMELVDGPTLAERLRRGPLRFVECLDLAESLADILESVHARGVVHRDLKPTNVVLEPVRLIDFGFAAFGQLRHERAGSRAYAAPEQLRAPGLTDGRADLYALGRVLFEAATGRAPQGPLVAELASCSGLDARLRALLTGLSEERVEERYSSAAELRADIRRARDGEHPRGPRGDEVSATDPTPFIGRSDELTRLLRAWTDAERGWGGPHIVRGARGSGKTRLMREVHHAIQGAAAGAWVASFTSPSATQRPISALRALLTQLVAQIERADEPLRRVLVPSLRRELGTELEGFGSALCPPLGRLLGGAPLSAGRVGADPFAEVAAELLVRVVRVLGPTLLTVDDAHWLDPVTRAVVARLVHRSRELRLLVLLFERDGEPGDAAAPEGAAVTTLSALDAGEVAELTHRHLGGRADPALVEYTAGLSDGSPLAVLEVLDAMMESGALAPSDGAFVFHRDQAERMHLPQGAGALLSRRLDSLTAATRRVFEVAANVGSSFDAELVGGVLKMSSGALEFAFAEGRRAGVVGLQEGAQYQFLHDSVREALIGAMSADGRRAVRQAIAETLDARGDVSNYRLVEHYGAGDLSLQPGRVIEVARAATAEALAAFDNEAALRFFTVGERAAAQASIELPWELHADAGEAELRLGAIDSCVERLGIAIRGATDVVASARLQGRLSWAHQAKGDPDASWGALERAFQILGHRLPKESPRTAVETAWSWSRSKLGGGTRAHDPATLELLCDLHYQNARLGFEYRKPARLLQSTLRARELALQLPVGESRAKTEAMYGVVMAMLGRRALGDRHLAEAMRMARDAGSPSVRAYCMQLRALAACFAGDFSTALQILETLIDEQGHWLEATEYCWNIHSAYLIESLRGRHRRAWEWLQRGIGRLARQGRRGSGFVQISHCTRATLSALWRELDEHDLARALRCAPDLQAGEGFNRIANYGARARALSEQGRAGHELDALIREFASEGIAPRNAHPMLAEYFIAVVQARVRSAIRARGHECAPALAQLDRAIADLSAIRAMPLYSAHLRVSEAYRAMLAGAGALARDKLAAASELADLESAPRVLYDVERCRAHLYRAEGAAEASRSRARAALHIARDGGAVHWETWIHEELDVRLVRAVSHSSTPAPPESPSTTSRHQLRTLLRMLRAGARQLVLDEEAEHLIDELIECVAADRALLVFEASPSAPLVVARGRDASVWTEQERARSLLEQARKSGMVEVRAARFVGVDRIPEGVAVPLWLRERTIGGIYLERDDPAAPFVDHDLDVVMTLSHQVTIALELARSLREQERLSSSLRQAQKMEAIGRFAGGMAHDFNNMLMVVVGSLDSLSEAGPHGPAIEPELDMIADAVERAKGLTRQLLTFARRQPRAVETHDINAVVEQLSPMLGRALGAQIEVRLDLAELPVPAEFDRDAFDQAVFNLAMNARHAMPNGGRFIIGSSHINVSETVATRHRDARPGPHVVLCVTDTGTGMAPDVASRAFDPFFTTRGHGEGTGLGLSTVYGFVHQSGGFVELESEPNVGTELRLHFPLGSATACVTLRPARSSRHPAPLTAPAVASARAPERSAAAASATQPHPTHTSPVRSAPAHTYPAPDTPTQPAPVPDAPAQPAPVRTAPSPVRNAPTQPSPVRNAPPQASAPSASSAGETSKGARPGPRILIVDDEPHVRRSLSRVLARAGYEAVLAGAPDEALQLAEVEPSLLISDVSMPGMSGPELARIMHERWPDMPVLYISGYTDVDGLDGLPFLQKPFSPADIRAAVSALLENW